MDDYRVVSSEVVYQGMIVNVRKDIIVLPDGKEAVREVVVHPGGSAILPMDDAGNVYLVRQHRQAAGGMVLEVPAGMLEPGETPADCAARELGEEVGFAAGTIAKVTGAYSVVGFCTERTHIFIATGLTPCERHLDDEEFITVEKYTLDDALAMVKSGEIVDGKTVTALMAAKLGLY